MPADGFPCSFSKGLVLLTAGNEGKLLSRNHSVHLQCSCSTASLVRFYNLDKCLETTIHLIKALTRQYNEIINILQSVSISYLRACMSTMANTWVSWVSLVKASENYIIQSGASISCARSSSPNSSDELPTDT